jgi:hypothetical protein
MKTTRRFVILTGLLLIGIAASCNLPASTAPEETKTPKPAPATSTATTTAPAEVTPTVSATPELAPICEADATNAAPPQCRTLDAKESSVFCVDKKPYNLILIDQGLTYESLTKGIRCSDAGKKDQWQRITCTGKMAYDFKLNVCDSTCVIPTVEAGTTQCPQGYNFNYYQGCCTQGFQQNQQNCKVYTFRTTTCVFNCSMYNNKMWKCRKQSLACVWNNEWRTCENRK